MLSFENEEVSRERKLRYTRALLNGADAEAFGIIEEMLLANRKLAEIYVDLIAPALTTVGHLWCEGEIGVGLEKLASQLALKHMDRLCGIDPAQERQLPLRALVSCVEGEQHYIGARMAADLLLSKGWSVDFLGPDVPTPALLDTIQVRRPHLVGLSVRAAQGLDHVRHLVEEITRLSDAPKILLGGQAIRETDWSQDGRCATARNAAEGTEIAARLFPMERPKAVLTEYLASLGRRVRDLRGKRGWTQEQLAESTRLTRVCIVAVEGGKQNVSMDVVIRLANALGTSPQRLLSADDLLADLKWRET